MISFARIGSQLKKKKSNVSINSNITMHESLDTCALQSKVKMQKVKKEKKSVLLHQQLLYVSEETA